MDRNYQGDILGPAHGQQQQQRREPERMEVPTLSDIGTIETKVQLFAAEVERVATDLKAALSTTHFKFWPFVTDPEPGANKLERKMSEESGEYRGLLSRSKQARKMELMDEWMLKEERGIEGRRELQDKVRYQGRGKYDDEVEKAMLRSTEMFRPTLEPYFGKEIPVREGEESEVEGSGSSREYEDAVEDLSKVSKEEKAENLRNQEDSYDKRGKLRLTRRPTFKKDRYDDSEGPAFAPR
ncbi:hypothetical protein EG329_004506 [Mollisiaceae sp. DMI_Dod_QoI]|nr:hypothetical protein EG329_004506 [Helotiales sp. DMI_Dod_QoI]